MNRWAWLAAGVAAAVILAATVAGLAARGSEDALSTLVAAERAFARMSIETSQREAFLANFADDGVWFTPAPSNTKEALRRQAPTATAGRMLDWDPVTGDVAASGDLGYTTGPWIKSERAAGGAAAKKLATGWFFSVWRWTADTGWKVVADFGVDAPHNLVLRGQTFKRASARASVPKISTASTEAADALRAADLAFAKRVTASGWAEALRTAATEDVRSYRGGHEPASGPAGAAMHPAGPLPSDWQPSKALASSAGDLGFTYGAYTEGVAPKVLRGYYLHVWKRVGGAWKLAVDVANVDERQGLRP